MSKLTEPQALALAMLAEPEHAAHGLETGAVTHRGLGHRHRERTSPQIASATARWLVANGYAERCGPARENNGFNWRVWEVRDDGQYVRITDTGRQVAGSVTA